MQRSAERTSSWGSRTAIIARQNQHVSRDPHVSEPCDAQREPQETKATERKKHHEEERVSERKVSISDDRREDQGAGRLAGQDALTAPHIDRAEGGKTHKSGLWSIAAPGRSATELPLVVFGLRLRADPGTCERRALLVGAPCETGSA